MAETSDVIEYADELVLVYLGVGTRPQDDLLSRPATLRGHTFITASGGTCCYINVSTGDDSYSL